jgi:hypothetical protein
LKQELSHLTLFEKRVPQAVYCMDIDSTNKPFWNYQAYEVQKMPDSYLPNSHNFFDHEDCNSFDKIKGTLIAAILNQKYKNKYSHG